jgi:hypothetical protein
LPGLNGCSESSEDQETSQKLRQSGDFERPAHGITRAVQLEFGGIVLLAKLAMNTSECNTDIRLGCSRPTRSAFANNVHNYRYPLRGLAATRVFLAATGKTLGLSLGR